MDRDYLSRLSPHEPACLHSHLCLLSSPVGPIFHRTSYKYSLFQADSALICANTIPSVMSSLNLRVLRGIFWGISALQKDLRSYGYARFCALTYLKIYCRLTRHLNVDMTLDGDSGQNGRWRIINYKWEMMNWIRQTSFKADSIIETLPSYIARNTFKNILFLQLSIVAKRYMTKKAKLIRRFRRIPADFRYHELVKLLDYFGYYEVATGKTSGSRVKFINKESTIIMFHKPHRGGIVKRYQLKQIKEVLGLWPT